MVKFKKEKFNADECGYDTKWISLDKSFKIVRFIECTFGKRRYEYMVTTDLLAGDFGRDKILGMVTSLSAAKEIVQEWNDNVL